jgi:hypothetical protein
MFFCQCERRIHIVKISERFCNPDYVHPFV